MYCMYIFYSFLASGMEPMCLSNFMTSSMQLAKECLSQRLTDDQGESFPALDGLEKFAETIETGILLAIDHVYSRFKNLLSLFVLSL